MNLTENHPNFRYTKWRHRFWKRFGIPGPDPLPFLGIMKSYKEKVCFISVNFRFSDLNNPILVFKKVYPVHIMKMKIYGVNVRETALQP